MPAIQPRLRDDHARRQFRLWTALGVLGAGLFTQQFTTLSKIKQVLLERAPNETVNALGQQAVSAVLRSWRVFASPADLALAVIILLAGAYIVWSEIKHGTCTALLHQAERSNRVLFSFLTVATIVITRCYLTPGQVFMGDSETHMLRSWMFVEHFRHMETPVWSNVWYGGFPLLEHYGSLYFIATALLTIVVGDIHLATKLLLWSCHVASVFTMFWFLREVTRRNLAALVGAIAYAISFFRLHILLYQGDLQVAVVFALFPLVLLLVERYLLLRSSARATFVLTTMTFAVMVVTHQGYAFFALVFLAIYLIARLAITGGSLFERFKVLLLFAGVELAALAMSSFLWVPFMFAMDEHRGIGNSAFPILIPNLAGPVMVVKLFRWALVSDGSSLGYVGVSIGVLAAIGIVHGLKRRIPAVAGLAACALASLLMVRNHVSYNIKNVDFFLIFICALAGWALVAVVEEPTRFAFVERARTRLAGVFPARVAVVFIALLIVDLGPTTFQSVFRENYQFKAPMYERVARLDDSYKVIERQVLQYDPAQTPPEVFDPNKLGIPSAYAPLQSPLGFFHEGAGRSFGYATEIVKNLHRDLNAGHLSDLSADGLYLLGVKYVMFRDRYRWYTPPLDPSPRYSISDGLLQLTSATPLLFSRQVIGISDVGGYPATDLIRERRYMEQETFDYTGRYFRDLVVPLIDTMHVDAGHGTAATLITRDGDFRSRLDGGSALDARIVSFSTDLKHVVVRYRSNEDAFGQLPYNYFPYLQVDVDGTPVHFYRSAMNHIIVAAPAGEHVVTIHGVIPPLQERLLWLSLAATVLVIAIPRRLFRGLRP
jgi:6-pyruvoyl-tetrahydropterin synthase related domain